MMSYCQVAYLFLTSVRRVCGGWRCPGNVIALCPEHHREAHYGAKSDVLRRRFLETLAAGPVREVEV